jgi:hypothetical protein
MADDAILNLTSDWLISKTTQFKYSCEIMLNEASYAFVFNALDTGWQTRGLISKL